MKRSLILFLLTTIFLSCSLLEKARRPLVEADKNSKTVPRAQYDELMKKYVALSKKKGNTGVEKTTIKPTKSSNGLDANIDSVDVFAEVNRAQKRKTQMETTGFASGNQIDKEIALLKKGLLYKRSGKADQALKIFQALEVSKIIQVKVRAKFFIGEILLEKKQYDLAMQSFESIVKNYAFSGLVIDSLKHLVTCTDQLGIVDKKQRYLYMLKDIFGAV